MGWEFLCHWAFRKNSRPVCFRPISMLMVCAPVNDPSKVTARGSSRLRKNPVDAQNAVGIFPMRRRQTSPRMLKKAARQGRSKRTGD